MICRLNAHFARFLLFIPFLLPPFLGGKRKGEKNNESGGQKSCLSARSYFGWGILILTKLNIFLIIQLYYFTFYQDFKYYMYVKTNLLRFLEKKGPELAIYTKVYLLYLDKFGEMSATGVFALH